MCSTLNPRYLALPGWGGPVRLPDPPRNGGLEVRWRTSTRTGTDGGNQEAMYDERRPEQGRRRATEWGTYCAEKVPQVVVTRAEKASVPLA